MRARNQAWEPAVRAAELPPEVLARVAEYATALWDGLGLRGSARVDFILTEDHQPYVLEVNSTPGMSTASRSATVAW
ncbi:hypothetical protein OG735_08765 [Streptomyces sp. NBC_01210]|uniref:hypothetical protein n=1 Tax=Streptomyces sp. NBC_01210 TaxID=2903774 RepID=UPI002E123F15|nr:hypothetical protein OG735_08765 [Streptomyces sp. NBC_01210]